MAQWFRLYEATLDDPKVQRLNDGLFKAWINLLCLACRHDGWLPPREDIAFALRKSEREIERIATDLESAGLLDWDFDRDSFKPHNWEGRQYKSDVSNDRVKRHRERTRAVTRNVASPATRSENVTPSESESETETESDKSSAPNGAGGEPPIDPVKIIFDEGIALLTGSGIPDRQARSLIGKWRSQATDARVGELIREAREHNISHPVEWMAKAVGNGGQREDYNTRRIRLAREAIR